MQIEYFNKFENLQISQNLAEMITVHGSKNFGLYFGLEKMVEVIWFLGKDEKHNEFLITLTISKKGFLKKGKFITNVMCLDTSMKNEKKLFLDQVIELIRQDELCDWVGQGTNWALFDVIPENAIYAPFGTYRTSLEGKDEPTLMQGFSRKVRQYIRRGLKNDAIVIKKDNHISDDSLSIINDVLEKGNLKKVSKANANAIEKYLADNMGVYTAYMNNEPCASVIVYFNKYATYAAYSGRKYDLPQEVMPVLFWTIILDALNRSNVFFDFVGALVDPEPGTKAHGIQNFKSKYGDFVQGYLWKIVINKNKYAAYSMLRKIMEIKNWKNGKRSKDIIDHERKRLLGLES